MKQEAEPVVGEVSETEADPLGPLDQQVDRLGGAVGGGGGGEVGEQLGLPGLDGAGESFDLGAAGGGGGGVEVVQPAAGVALVAGAVDVAQLLQGDPGAAEFAGRVADAEAGQQLLVLLGGQPLGAAAQQPADAVERIAAAAPVTEGLVLHPATHLVNGVDGRRVAWKQSSTTVAPGSRERSAVW